MSATFSGVRVSVDKMSSHEHINIQSEDGTLSSISYMTSLYYMFYPFRSYLVSPGGTITFTDAT